MLAPWKESWDKPRQCIKKQKHHFANKGLYSQSYGFSSSYLWVLELEDKEGWTLKNWYFWIVVLEKTLESPLDCKEVKPVKLKGNPPWIFTGRTDAEAEAPIIWSPDGKKQLIGKDPDAGKDWRQKEKRQQSIRWLDGITDSVDVNLRNSGRWWRTGKPGVLQAMESKSVRHNLATEQ